MKIEPATVQDVLTYLDAMEREVTSWEKHFLEGLIEQTYPITKKQMAVLTHMAEAYCRPPLVAEMRGQMRLF